MMRYALFGLLVLCIGPAPGEVGGCGDSEIPADARDFCQQRDAWECRRAEARGEITDVQACVDEIPAACSAFNWPFMCRPFPTNREAQACIDALALQSNVNTPLNEIGACQLCGGGS